MEIIEYTEENYDFKKSLQRNIIKNIQPLLYKNGFVKYNKRHYVRELDGLAQFISFYVRSTELKVWATYMPIFIPGANSLRYGVDITGSSGMDLLDGKYYTFLNCNTKGVWSKS